MPVPAKIFYCYAREDEALRNKLETHLAKWHDREIPPGADWGRAIDQHINTADLILLLISPDFLASDYCHDIEMKRALERHDAEQAVVVPVILRSVDWAGAPFEHLQALPTDAKPVTSWRDPDEAFTDIVRGIRHSIETRNTAPKRALCAGRRGFVVGPGVSLDQKIISLIWEAAHAAGITLREFWRCYEQTCEFLDAGEDPDYVLGHEINDADFVLVVLKSGYSSEELEKILSDVLYCRKPVSFLQIGDVSLPRIVSSSLLLKITSGHEAEYRSQLIGFLRQSAAR